jgi:cytochrome c553
MIVLRLHFCLNLMNGKVQARQISFLTDMKSMEHAYMLSKKIWFTVLSLCMVLDLGMNMALGSPIPAILTGDPTAGKAKMQACISCHGDTGNSPQEMATEPKLAGQHEKYLIKQMIEFQKGATGPRPNGIMLGFVQNLSEQDIKDIAAYYATQNITLGSVPVSFLPLGQQIYRGGILKSGIPACGACHDADGRGNALMSTPALSGQHPEYIVAQMQAFKAGLRKNDLNGMMRDIAKKMSDEEIQAVAQYVSGLH